MPSSVARRKSSTFSLLYMRTSSGVGRINWTFF